MSDPFAKDRQLKRWRDACCGAGDDPFPLTKNEAAAILDRLCEAEGAESPRDQGARRCDGHCHCHAGPDGLMHPPCCADCAPSASAARRDAPLKAEPCCTRCKKAGQTECSCPIALPLPYGPVDPVCRWPVPMKQREWDSLRAFCDRIPDKMLAGQVRGMVSMMATAWYEVATLRNANARLRAGRPVETGSEERR